MGMSDSRERNQLGGFCGILHGHILHGHDKKLEKEKMVLEILKSQV